MLEKEGTRAWEGGLQMPQQPQLFSHFSCNLSEIFLKKFKENKQKTKTRGTRDRMGVEVMAYIFVD
jgi:cytochrome c1